MWSKRSDFDRRDIDCAVRGSSIQVDDVSSSLPALSSEQWARLDGDPESLRLARAILIAHSKAIANPLVIASQWTNNHTELLGLAIAIAETRPNGRRVLTIEIPGAMHPDRVTGIWWTRGVALEEVGLDLVRALVEYAAGEGIAMVAIANCAPSDPWVALGEQLGGRAVPAPVDNRIELPAAMPFEAFLAAMPAKRRWDLKRDLRRAHDAAQISHEELSPASADALWPLMFDTFLRKGSSLRFRDNLLRLLVDELGDAVAASVLRLPAGDVLGFIAYYRVGSTTHFSYIAHVDRPELHIYPALMVSALEHEIARGASQLLFGFTSEAFKHRIGCMQLPRAHVMIPTHGARLVPLPRR